MAISVIVVLGDGTREKASISDAFILSEEIAYRRGLSILYDQWYMKKIRDVKTPMDQSLDEGQKHYINNPRAGIQEDAVIRRVTHTLTPRSMTSSVTFESVVRFE